MATRADVGRRIAEISHKIALKVDSTPTGVKPGYRPGLKGTVLPNGRLIDASDTPAGGAAIGCWLILDDAQAIPSGLGGGPGTDNVSFDTPIYDTNSFWDIGTPDTFTIPVAGAYYITYTVEWDVDATGYRESYLQHNAFDAAFSRQEARMVLSASPTDDARGTVVTAGTPIQASAGDTLILKVKQSSGGDLNVIEPYVKIQYVGPKIT